ncbi:hypothetical protein [Pleurocapsa sp. FMAR1]|uniref:hypothetical protein n=1 Tax=Pleurocapsa sp. FMAR1 TaxID=3040204 RepID=UPI0029C691B0|nr:hypothetical protein [Pleurocapsa sp. FMAR1]
MFILSKVDFRRLLAVCLISLVLFLGSASAVERQNTAFAEVLERDTVGIPEEKPLSGTEYESAKANRNRLQAELSQQAEAEAEAKTNSESVAEKLNLNEIKTPSIDGVDN